MNIKRELARIVDTPEAAAVYKKIKETGLISLTAQDHEMVGSTSPEILVKNPGQTLGELMSAEEMSSHLAAQKKKCAAAYERDFLYLISIGRLPPEVKGDEKRARKKFTDEDGRKIAEALGVRFAGVQRDKILPDIYLFNDDFGTGTSFMAEDLEDAKKRFQEIRQSFKKSLET